MDIYGFLFRCMLGLAIVCIKANGFILFFSRTFSQYGAAWFCHYLPMLNSARNGWSDHFSVVAKRKIAIDMNDNISTGDSQDRTRKDLLS